MRIAITNHDCIIRGGVETYLSQLMPELQRRGYEIAFWHEEPPAPSSRPQVVTTEGVPAWSVDELGMERAIDTLKKWKPDVIYGHGLYSPVLERETQRIAPSVFFAHSYHGTCVSGAKTFRLPSVKVCDKRFGWRCFLNYYPRRCGGLNPLTMIKEHQRQAERLELLANYQLIVVVSEHMANEYREFGFADRVRVIRYSACLSDEVAPIENSRSSEREWRLLFLGRMEFLKGGDTFLDALPMAQRELGVTLNVTFAGDGPLRAKWQQRAQRLADCNANLKFNFTGWVAADRHHMLARDCDLIVVPSLWPEPFGKIGLEMGQHGIPSVAFAVGGIPQWLSDGVNGILAAPDKPKAKSLAKAIVRCLQDADTYQRLRQGARRQSSFYTMEAHLSELVPLLTATASHVPDKGR